MSPQDVTTENSSPPNSTTTTVNVRMSDCLQNGHDGVNPFASGHLESGQFEVGNENGGYKRFGVFHSYNITRRHEILTKVKEAANRHCNEYRIAVIILVVLILIGFSVLVRLNKNILSMQNPDSMDSSSGTIGIPKICNGDDNCCTEENKCGEMEGDCNSDNDCLEGLKCGENNCNANSGHWDSTDDCCFKPKDSGLTSSSIFENNTKKWGPEFVIDGKISRNDKGFFHSEREDYPWLQWHLPRQVKIMGITVTNRVNCCGDRLRDVEIRAGKYSTENGFKGQIKVNELCGKFTGPGEDGREYTISCDHTISADYLTIQLLDDRAILAINEIRVETISHGSGCKGGDSCCTTSIPCGEWEGDCDSDDQCQAGLLCGHNNCPLKPTGYWAHGDWDTTDDCCYRARNATGTATSSSTYADEDDQWGPKNAIDGLWSDANGLVFRSKEEHMPWIQWHLPNTTKMIGIMISNRNMHSDGHLKHVEIRAGTTFVESNFTGKMRINELCGTLDGPGKDRRVYTIMCKKEIEADYVTLQILDLHSVLQINELEIIRKSEEPNLGCDCHEYINQNGYGQCRKKDFNQEHVKDLHVCYVNQPSNCTDLYASITDPGKKLSAQACPIGDAQETTTTKENEESFKCYHYTIDEDEMIDSEAKNKEVCERHPGFVFTKGDESKAPGCSDGCWCCQPI